MTVSHGNSIFEGASFFYVFVDRFDQEETRCQDPIRQSSAQWRRLTPPWLAICVHFSAILDIPKLVYSSIQSPAIPFTATAMELLEMLK